MNVGPESQAPGWEWFFIGLYFFVGGTAAGAYFIGSLAELFGGERFCNISKYAYYIAFPLILPAPILLIGDLGRMERFWHLFVYSRTGFPYINWQSPLSVGSWALLLFGAMTFLSFVDNLIGDGIAERFYGIPGVRGLATLFGETYHRIPRKIYAVVGSLAGFFVASYTGVLLDVTAHSFWAATDPVMGALFLASAASTGAAAIALVMIVWQRVDGEAFARLANLDRIALILEFILLVAMVILAGRYIAPLMVGGYALMFWGGVLVLGVIVPFALNWYASRSPNAHASLAVWMALLSLLGGVLLRISVVTAGQAGL